MKKIFLVIIFICVFFGAFWVCTDLRVRSFIDRLFAIKIINVEGNIAISGSKIVRDSGLKYNENIFRFDPQDIKCNLEKIGEIENVIVIRRIPCMFNIVVEERKPIAYWKSKDKLYYIDMKGKEFPIGSIKLSKKLPLVLGENAQQEACNLIRQLDRYPNLKEQVVFCNFVGKRRWNIQMSNDVLIKLPEENVRSAVSYLSRICDSNGQFDKNLSVIDLRVGNRVILREKAVSKSVNKRKSNEI